MKEQSIQTDVEAFEQTIDVLAESLSARLNENARPVRERNTKRWEDFAKICRTPVIGQIYFNRMHGYPKGLEDEPDHKDESFWADVKRIEQMAKELEGLKAANLDIYGDEIVDPMNPGDPGGYYTPDICTRRACYETLHLKPAIPEKYDFTSLAGVEKNSIGINVMDSATKEVLPFNDCTWYWQAEVGIRYHKKISHRSHLVDPNGLGMVLTRDKGWATYDEVAGVK